MDLKLGDKIFHVDKNLELYNKYKNLFQTRAIDAAKEYCDIYIEAGNIENALDALINHYYDNVNKSVKLACKILFQHGICDVSTDIFMKRYHNEYFDIYVEIQPICEKLQEIFDYQEELEDNLNARKASRGHWEGGGFGLKGAIKGAVTASALNAVGGAVHGIGDFFRSMSNDSKVRNLKSELYNDDSTMDILNIGIYFGCLGIFDGLRDELESHNILTPIDFKTTEARAIMENALEFAKDKKTQNEYFIKCIFMSPYTYSLYDPLRKSKDVDGWLEFADYFGAIDYELFFNYIWVKKKLRKVSMLKEYSFFDKWNKLVAHFPIDIMNHDMVVSYIEALSNDILKIKCNSKSDIEKILNHIENNTPSDLTDYQLDLIIKIQDKFKSQYDEIVKNDERLRITKLPEFISSEIIHKIEEYIKFSEKYNCDESEDIIALISKLAKKCSNCDDVNEIISKLKQIDCEKYPFLATAITAFEAKTQIYSFEDKCEHYTTYTFSPSIIDAVEEARNNNPICQQWLIQLICNNWLIKQLSNDQSDKTIQQYCDLLSSVIMYLFDKPEKYPFDLFMRLKFNGIYFENADEHIEAMHIFKEDSACPAGIYEYGSLVYTHLDKGTGLGLIKDAADMGYMRAVDFLYNYYKADNANSSEALFYEILLSGSSKYSELYKKGEDDPDQDAFITTGWIKLNLEGNYSFFVHGEKIYSRFLHWMWSEFSRSTKKYQYYKSVGYIGGDISDRMLLKLVKSHLSVKSNETCAFALQSQDDGREMMLTNRNIYWKNKDTIYYKPYSTDIHKGLGNAFGKRNSEDGMLYQLYVLMYYSCKPYSADLPINVLERMAFCGHPLAICNLLFNKEYEISDDKKEIWLKNKKLWESKGKYYAVCPNCHEERTAEDAFCPECGAKIY